MEKENTAKGIYLLFNWEFSFRRSRKRNENEEVEEKEDEVSRKIEIHSSECLQ